MCNSLKKCSAYILLLVVSFLICLVFSQNPIHNYYFADDAYYEYVGKLINQGFVPYRDIWDHKGPIVYWWYAIGYKIYPMTGMYFLEVLNLFLSMSLSYNIAKRYLNNICSLLIVIVLFLNIPYKDSVGNTEMLSLLPILYLIHLVDIYINKLYLKKIDYISIGLIISILFFIKPLYLVSPCVLCLYILSATIKNKDIKELKKLFLYGGMGFVVPTIIILMWLTVNHAIMDFYTSYIEFNIAYTLKNNTEGRGSLWGTFYFFVKQPIIILSTLSIVYILINKKKHEVKCNKFIYLLIITFIITFVLLVLPKNMYFHYLIILFPIILYLLIFATKNVKSNTVLIVILETLIIMFSHTLYSSVAKHHEKELAKDKKYREIASVISQELESNETFASLISDMTKLHLYSNRHSATKYPFLTIYNRIYPEKVKEEFSKIKPKIIVTLEDDEITLVSKKPLKINIEKKIRLSELFNVNDYNVIYRKNSYIIYKLK
ncbi:MAG: hypothetical protein J6J35_00115 [Alphaproteobacteria bacterium]|nr:hypothetical protein [Alphaproteobacteria bacterium]